MNKHLMIVLALCFGSGAAIAQPKSASEPKLLIKSSQGLMAPVWSPNGDKIAVTTDNYSGILVANADGTNLRQITEAHGVGYKMRWSDDGTEILGRTNVTDNNRVFHEVKTWNIANKSEKTIVSKTRKIKGTPLWSTTDKNAYTIMVNDPAGATDQIASLKQFSGKIIINPAISQDGKKVAFQIPGKGIYVCSANGDNLKYLGKGSHPSWLPDNTSIIYTIVKDDGSRFTESDIYSMDTNSGKSVLLTSNTELIPLTPSVTRDGKKVAFENAQDASIYVITLKY